MYLNGETESSVAETTLSLTLTWDVFKLFFVWDSMGFYGV